MDEVWNICYKGHVTCLTYHSIQATAELPCICHILPVSVKAGGIFRFINPFFYQGTGNLHENRFLDRFWWLWTQWRSWTTISEMNRKNHLAFLTLFDSPSAIYFYWMLKILLILTNWLRHFRRGKQRLPERLVLCNPVLKRDERCNENCNWTKTR